MRAITATLGAASLGLLALSTPAFADWPAGADITPSVIVDITPEGFGALEDIVVSLVPPLIEVPGVSDYDEEEVDLGLFDFELYSYEYSIDNINIFLNVTEVAVIPDTDELTLSLGLTIEVGRSDDRIELDADAEALGFISLGQSCSIYLDPLTIDAQANIGLSLVTGANGQVLDVDFGDINYDLSFNGDSFNSSGCVIGDVLEAVDDVLDFFGVDGGLLGLMLDLVTPEIDAQLNAILPELETTIEDAFGLANFTDTIDVLGKPLTINFYPDDFQVSPAGLRLELAGSFDGGFSDPCIAQYDSGLSLQTYYGYPAIGDGIAGLTHHAGLFLNDDTANQALYAVWRSGLLCQSLSSDNSAIDLPLPLNSALVGILAGETFADLFEDGTKPLIINTRPTLPPIATTAGDHAIDLEIEGMGLDMYSEVDGRMTRLMGLNLEATAGVDVDFYGDSGEVEVLLDFDPSAIHATVDFNDHKPDGNADIEDGFAGLIDTLVTPLLAGALEDILVALPSVEGLGLTGMSVGGAGPGGDFIGAFATIGLVDYGSEDAGVATDCGGCSSSSPAPWGFVAFPLLTAGLRRRKTA